MPDTVLGVDWNDIHSGEFVRWATPRFVKYGVVINRDGRSMSLDLTDEDRPRVIPDARWYFTQDPTSDEHLCVIEEIPDIPGIFFKKPREEWITVQQACELVRMDTKQFRRHVRSGRVTARKRDDRWMIERDHLISVATNNGWL